MSQIWTPDNQIPEVRSIGAGGTALDRWLLSDETYTLPSGSRTSADIRITPDTALASTVVLASCRLLAETIAGLPLWIMRRTKDGGAVQAPESPLYRVLSFCPNEWQTKFEFFEQMVMNLTLWGNAYCRIRSGKYGSVSALDNLHPSNMIVERLVNGRLRYTYTDPLTGEIEKFLQEDVLHIRWTPEPDGIKGMVPVEVAREAIALARACEIHAAKYWANSARPGVVLKTALDLSPDAASLLRDNWERIHKGADKAYRTCILTNGLEPVPIGFDAQQSQFMDARRFQTEEITRVYRLPIALIQGESVGNLEAIGRQFVTYTLVPWLNRIEGAISRSLIWNDDLFYAEFDTKALMRADPNSRAAYYSTMQGLGIFSINDSRNEEGLPPIEHGDKHFVAMNLIPLEEAVKGPQPQGGPGMAPPAVPGGPPSLPGVTPGEAPPEGAEGKQSQPATDLKPGDATTLPDGSIGEIKEIVQAKKIAIVIDADGKEQSVKISDLKAPPKEEEAVEERALSKQSEALKESQAQIAREHGRWTQRDAQYKNTGEECRSCVFFEGEGTCEIVKGIINPAGSCRLAIVPPEKLIESRDCGRVDGGRFGQDNKCQKDGDGSSGGGSSESPAPTRDASKTDIPKILEAIASNPDGFTIDPVSAESPTDGIMVSEFPNDDKRSVQLPANAIESAESKSKVAGWIAANSDVLGDPSRFVGGWLSNGQFYLDVATRYDNDKAEEALESARKHGQLAVFNLKTKKATWVKFDSDKKPEGWDEGFRKARKDAAVDDLNENEDWTNLDELDKHGKNTVRSLKRKKRNGKRKGVEVRHSDNGKDEARNVQSDEGLLREEGKGIREGIGPVLVQRRSGRPSRTVRQLVAEARDILGDLMPEVSYRDISPALAVYDDEKNILYVNPTKCRRLSLCSQPNPILHEASHAVHFAESRDTYLAAPELTQEQRMLAVSKVSRAAAEGAREFVAEVIAGSLVGIQFPDEVIETFKELAGRDIRRL